MKLLTVCYIRHDNKTLMLHRTKKHNDIHEGMWVGLGGKFEEGETPEACIIREVYEESGLEIKSPKLKWLVTLPNFYGTETWYIFVFFSDTFTGELTECNEGELAWIENDKLLDLNLWEGDKIFIPWIDEEGFFSGNFMYRDKKLVEYSFQKYT